MPIEFSHNGVAGAGASDGQQSRQVSFSALKLFRCRVIVHRVSSRLLGPVHPSSRAFSGHLEFTARRHNFNKDILSSHQQPEVNYLPRFGPQLISLERYTLSVTRAGEIDLFENLVCLTKSRLANLARRDRNGSPQVDKSS